MFSFRLQQDTDLIWMTIEGFCYVAEVVDIVLLHPFEQPINFEEHRCLLSPCTAGYISIMHRKRFR